MGFANNMAKAGGYGSVSEIMREARLQALRETLNAAIAAGGAHTDEELGDAIEAEAAKLVKQGY